MFFFILAGICGLGALIAVFAGFATVGHEGAEMKKRSNKLMQWRVRLQIGAIVFALLGAASV